jgi:hypothetical protein
MEKAEIEKPEIVEIVSIFQRYGDDREMRTHRRRLERKPEAWRDFIMRFELGLEEPHPKRAFRISWTIGASYLVGLSSITMAKNIESPQSQEKTLTSTSPTVPNPANEATPQASLWDSRFYSQSLVRSWRSSLRRILSEVGLGDTVADAGEPS